MSFGIKFPGSALVVVLTLTACGAEREEAEGQEMAITTAAAVPLAPSQARMENATMPVTGGSDALVPDEADTALATDATASGNAPASASAGAPANPSPAATIAAASAERPAAFAICGACHSVERGKNGIGPSLAGVFGSKSASKPDFSYTDAMKASGLVWNAASLDRYLTDPMGVVPGTTMAYPGVKDATQRAAIIAYLKTL